MGTILLLKGRLHHKCHDFKNGVPGIPVVSPQFPLAASGLHSTIPTSFVIPWYVTFRLQIWKHRKSVKPSKPEKCKNKCCSIVLGKKYVLSCKQNYWFNADLVFWKHRSNMDGWIQWSWSILGEHILQLSLCMLFWSQQPVLPMCMLHLLTRAAEVGSGESFFKHKRKQGIKKKNVLQYLSSKQQFCWTAGRCRSEYGQQVESWGRCVRKAHNQQEISSTQAHICFCFPCERGQENFNVTQKCTAKVAIKTRTLLCCLAGWTKSQGDFFFSQCMRA